RLAADRTSAANQSCRSRLAMNHLEFQLRALGDPRLAPHAASPLPAWLWSTDGTRIMWANPVGAKLFGAANGAALADKTFGPADQHRRQVAQIANRLLPSGAIRLERLRGFGAPPGMLATCGCARLDFADGSHGILVTAVDAATRFMPLAERLQRLVEGLDAPVAAFARDGRPIASSDAARSLPGFRDLAEAGLDEARDAALKHGRAERSVGGEHLILQRVGSGADVGLIAFFESSAALCSPPARGEAGITLVDEFAEPSTEPTATATDYEAPASSGEAPAEFALIDEFAEQPAIENPAAEAMSEEAIAESLRPESDGRPHEPSPYIEAVADEPEAAAPSPSPSDDGQPAHQPTETTPAPIPVWLDEAAPRTLPLRFTWQMDAEGHFSLGSDEFTHLIGARTATGLGRPWREIADTFALDPEGRVLAAFATRNTWSGITLNWPVDGGECLPVELSGLP